MNQYTDYVEKLINEIKIAEIQMYRDVAYSRAMAVIQAFCSFNHIGLGETKRLEEEARAAFKEWPCG